jgi:hypothetical protein
MIAFGNKILIDGEKVIVIPRINPTTGNEQWTPSETYRVAEQIATFSVLVDALERSMPAIEYYDEHEGAPDLLKAVKAVIAKAKGE